MPNEKGPQIAYSAERHRNEALELKITRAKIMCNGNNPDFAIKHPDWCRDGKQKNYTVMIKRIKEDFAKNEKLWKDREARRHHD